MAGLDQETLDMVLATLRQYAERKLTLDYLLQKSKPDLVLLTRAPEDLGSRTALGLDMLADSLQEELVTISEVPMIIVSQSSPC